MSGEPTLDVGTPEPVAAPEPTATESTTPTIAETLARSYAEIEAREADPNAPPAAPRGTDGRYTPKAPAAAATATQTTDQPATQGNEPPSAAIVAPQSWSADMKALFPTLSPDAQKYVAQRESEAHAKISDQGNKLATFDGISKAIEPHRNALTAAYGSVDRGIGDLLTLRSAALADPARFLIDFARGAGIRLDQLPQLAAQAPQAQPADPRIAALSRQVESLQSNINTQALGEAQKLVDAFKVDPKNKHYATLENRIAELLHQGSAKDLPHAYKLALRENDQLVEQEFAERQAESKKTADAEAARLATEARRANVVNIRTNGGRQSPSAPTSVRASLEKAYDRANGAA